MVDSVSGDAQSHELRLRAVARMDAAAVKAAIATRDGLRAGWPTEDSGKWHWCRLKPERGNKQNLTPVRACSSAEAAVFADLIATSKVVLRVVSTCNRGLWAFTSIS